MNRYRVKTMYISYNDHVKRDKSKIKTNYTLNRFLCGFGKSRKHYTIFLFNILKLQYNNIEINVLELSVPVATNIIVLSIS